MLSEKNFRTIEIVDQTNFAESTIRGIVSRKEEIKDAYTSLQKRSVSNQSRLRDSKILKMEDHLYVWICDCNDKNIYIDGVMIQSKAKKLMTSCYPNETYDFKASDGWYQKFRTRYNLHKVSCLGEIASAVTEAAEEFKLWFSDFFKKTEYRSDQIYNADETGLYYKKQPNT